MNDFVQSITQAQLPTSQYVNEVFTKFAIVLHHTASPYDPYNAINWWKKTSEKVGTAFVIGGYPDKSKRWKDGEIVQCFSSAKAAWHLGVTSAHLKVGGPNHKSSTYLNLNTIGIEVAAYGQLTLKNDKFLAYTGAIVPDSQVVEYNKPFRGFKYYHKYTDAQLDSLRKLIIYLGNRYELDVKFPGMEIFDVDKKSLCGERPLFLHVSVRPDKFDIHPQPELISMLESL